MYVGAFVASDFQHLIPIHSVDEASSNLSEDIGDDPITAAVLDG